MAFITCNFFSNVLNINMSMNVVIPQKGVNKIKTKNSFHPVLYLLHGLSDDHTSWTRKTSIERYAENNGLAVVMPCVNRSFYCDMYKGYKYWAFISEELPNIAKELFHLSNSREDNYVAGLSMGGYGAIKLGLRKPDRFSIIGSLSGALDLDRIYREKEVNDLDLIIDPDIGIKDTHNDLFHLLDHVSTMKNELPLIYQCCGTEDFLYEDNLRFKSHCDKNGIDVIYEEERGAHEWEFWDRKIQNFFKIITEKNRMR